MYSSTDAITWSEVSFDGIPVGISPRFLGYINNKFWIFDTWNKYYSEDGVHWTPDEAFSNSGYFGSAAYLHIKTPFKLQPYVFYNQRDQYGNELQPPEVFKDMIWI